MSTYTSILTRSLQILHIFKGFELYCNNRHLTHSEFDQVAFHREIGSCLTLSNFSIDYVEIPSRQDL